RPLPRSSLVPYTTLFRSPPFAWQEAFKAKRVGGEAGPCKGGQDGRGARNRHHPDACLDRTSDQEESGIGHDWRARVGDEGDIGACLQALEQHNGFLFLVEVMI